MVLRERSPEEGSKDHLAVDVAHGSVPMAAAAEPRAESPER